MLVTEYFADRNDDTDDDVASDAEEMCTLNNVDILLLAVNEYS